jgi:hypothetical protein
VRLQLLAEIGVGWRIRSQADVEEYAVRGLKRAIGGGNGSR